MQNQNNLNQCQFSCGMVIIQFTPYHKIIVSVAFVVEKKMKNFILLPRVLYKYNIRTYIHGLIYAQYNMYLIILCLKYQYFFVLKVKVNSLQHRMIETFYHSYTTTIDRGGNCMFDDEPQSFTFSIDSHSNHTLWMLGI